MLQAFVLCEAQRSTGAELSENDTQGIDSTLTWHYLMHVLQLHC